MTGWYSNGWVVCLVRQEDKGRDLVTLGMKLYCMQSLSSHCA